MDRRYLCHPARAETSQLRIQRSSRHLNDLTNPHTITHALSSQNDRTDSANRPKGLLPATGHDTSPLLPAAMDAAALQSPLVPRFKEISSGRPCYSPSESSVVVRLITTQQHHRLHGRISQRRTKHHNQRLSHQTSRNRSVLHPLKWSQRFLSRIRGHLSSPATNLRRRPSRPRSRDLHFQ